MSDTDKFKEQLRAAEERLTAGKANWRDLNSHNLFHEADRRLDDIVIKGRSHDLVFEVLVLTAEARIKMAIEDENFRQAVQ